MSFKKNIISIFYGCLVLLLLTSCSFKTKSNEKSLRMGFMPNVTHAEALVGIGKEIYKNELGKLKVHFKPIPFLVGNSVIDAFITNQIDVAYIGPGPYVNALYRRIPIKLLANSANLGTTIVGKLGIDSLKPDMRIAVPQYGNTQDLLLRYYLQNSKLEDKIKIFSIPSQDTATAFFTRSIDAACLPEPWGTILVEKGVCKIIVDEKNILKNVQYPVTVLVANEQFVQSNPEVVNSFLNAHEIANSFIRNNQDEAVDVILREISNVSKQQIDRQVIAKAFTKCEFSTKVNPRIPEEFKLIGEKAGYYRKGFW